MTYTDQFNNWVDVFVDSCHSLVKDSLKKNRQPVIVAMSRKMTRMLRLLQQKQLLKLDASVCVISEHAVCSTLVSLKRIKGDSIDVAIVDDAIYFGSTINNISNAVFYIIGRKPKVLSIVRNASITEIKNGILEKTDNTITIDQIPFVAQQISESLVSTNYPIDFEFPIVKIVTEKNDYSANQIVSVLAELFVDSDVYSINRSLEGTESHNFTVLLDSKKKSFYPTNEFSKLRIFPVQGQWIIETYAPQDIDEDSIRFKRRIFVNDQLEDVWQNLLIDYSPVEISCQSGDLLQVKRLKDDYDYLRISSLVTLANYLYSFYTLSSHWQKLMQAFTRLGIQPVCHLSTDDLQLLVGEKRSQHICAIFQNILSDKSISLEPENQTYQYGSEQKVAPNEYKNKFEILNMEAWGKAKKEEEALDMLFTYQRHFMSMDFSGTNMDKNNRLRFGVSYASLIEDARLFLLHGDPLVPIHYWMDSMIDLGVIAPKYLRISSPSKIHWRRMFRCGENDSPLMKSVRVCLQIIKTIFSVVKSTQIEENDLKALLSMVLFNPFHLLDGIIDRLPFSKDENSFVTQPVYQEHMNRIDLLDFMRRYGFLEVKERNELICYCLSSHSIVYWFNLTVVFDEVQQNQLHHYIRYIWETTHHIPILLRSFILSPSASLFLAGVEYLKAEFRHRLDNFLSLPCQDSRLNDILAELEQQTILLYRGNVQLKDSDYEKSEDNEEMEHLFAEYKITLDKSHFQCNEYKKGMEATERLIFIHSLGQSLLDGDQKMIHFLGRLLSQMETSNTKIEFDRIGKFDYKGIAETLRTLID